MSAAEKGAPGKAGEALVAATVANGRTVVMPGKKFGPGQTVQLPLAEVDQLRRCGYLVDEKAAAPMIGNGPTFSSESGPSVKAA